MSDRPATSGPRSDDPDLTVDAERVVDDLEGSTRDENARSRLAGAVGGDSEAPSRPAERPDGLVVDAEPTGDLARDRSRTLQDGGDGGDGGESRGSSQPVFDVWRRTSDGGWEQSAWWTADGARDRLLWAPGEGTVVDVHRALQESVDPDGSGDFRVTLEIDGQVYETPAETEEAHAPPEFVPLTDDSDADSEGQIEYFPGTESDREEGDTDDEIEYFPGTESDREEGDTDDQVEYAWSSGDDGEAGDGQAEDGGAGDGQAEEGGDDDSGGDDESSDDGDDESGDEEEEENGSADGESSGDDGAFGAGDSGITPLGSEQEDRSGAALHDPLNEEARQRVGDLAADRAGDGTLRVAGDDGPGGSEWIEADPTRPGGPTDVDPAEPVVTADDLAPHDLDVDHRVIDPTDDFDPA